MLNQDSAFNKTDISYR